MQDTPHLFYDFSQVSSPVQEHMAGTDRSLVHQGSGWGHPYDLCGSHLEIWFPHKHLFLKGDRKSVV